MKKAYYFLFACAPVLVGYIYNITLMGMLSITFLGSLIFYVLPFAMLCFWFWVGQKYSQLKIPAFCTILIGNSMGILSLLIYIWQFVFLSDQQRNLFLAVCSQYFSAAISFLTAKVAVLFEPQKNVIGSVSATGNQIIGLIVMVLVFTAGFLYKKRRVAK